MIIKPASELRNNFTGISKLVREGETIFLTRNGSGDMVVMSQDMYNRQMAMIELYRHLGEGEKDIAAGKVRTTEQVFDRIDNMLNAKRG